jgi:hypothetical protein
VPYDSKFDQLVVHTVDTKSSMFRRTPKIRLGQGPLLNARRYIESIFTSLDINPVWDERIVGWIVEIGTPPFEIGLPEKEMHDVFKSRLTFQMAAMIASKCFPEIAPDALQPVNESWARFSITFRQTVSGELYLVMGSSFRGIRDKQVDLWRLFKDMVVPDSLFWFDRASFMMLTECMAASYDHSVVQRYLFDDLIVRELCTWIGPLETVKSNI